MFYADIIKIFIKFGTKREFEKCHKKTKMNVISQ